MHKVLIQFGVVVAAVVGLSLLSSGLGGGRQEAPGLRESLAIDGTMTVAHFGQRNELPPRLLQRVFDLESPQDRQKAVTAFGMSTEQIVKKTQGLLALRAEQGSKDWVKILAKFGLWLVFLGAILVLLVRGRITAANRKWLLLGATGVFGVILGSDPSPMGTVKDAIVLLGSRGVIFPPRLIAFGVFLLMVIIANKFICSWGCQLGTLQDTIFRLNRDKGDRKGVLRQVKVPFAVSNAVRVAFFITIAVFAFVWATDIVEGIDPFKVFKPRALAWLGGTFVGIVLIASLFVYRPWCHFFCPFGLVGWAAERISLFKVHVDYDKCLACGSCEKACPSTVMGAILRRDRTIPDCFSCGTCMEVCPAGAISFGTGGRSKPPAGKFAADSITLGTSTIKQQRA